MAIPLSNLFDPNKRNKPSPIQTDAPTSPSSVQQPQPITEGQQAAQPTTTVTPVKQPVVQETQQAAQPVGGERSATKQPTTTTTGADVPQEGQRVAGQTTTTTDAKTGETKTTKAPDREVQPPITEGQAAKTPTTKTETPVEGLATRTPTTIEEVITTPPPETPQLNVDLAADILNKWIAGEVDDEVFKRSLNKAVSQLGVYNQTQLQDLEQKIANDPNLQGQGAGMGLLMMMSRDQGFNVGQVMQNLSVESMNRIIDMQQYGIGKAFELRQQRIDNQFRETGLKLDERRVQVAERGMDVTEGHLDVAKDRLTLDERRVDIEERLADSNLTDAERRRLHEDLNFINTVLRDFDAAAEGYTEYFANQGIPVNITADSLRAMDPLVRDQALDKLAQAREYAAGGNTELAADIIDELVSDPATADWFAEGTTGENWVESFQSGNFATNLQESRTIQNEINLHAQGDEGFDEVRASYQRIEDLGLRNFEAEGDKLSLEKVNEIYEANGMPTVDSLEDLGPAEKSELAKMKDYMDKQEGFDSGKYYDAILEYLKGSPNAQEFLQEDIFVNGQNALRNVADAIYYGGNFTVDPDTGIITPNQEFENRFWMHPRQYHHFYTWPDAEFDGEGNLATDADGNPLEHYQGGDPYDGETWIEADEDPDLDKKWQSFLNANPDTNTTAREWYYGTAAGKLPYDASRVPDSVGGGSTGGGGGSGRVDNTTGFVEPNPDLSFEDRTKAEETWQTVNSSGTASFDDAIRAAEAGAIQTMTNMDLPTNERNFNQFLEDNPSGFVNMGGFIYKLSRDNETGRTIIETKDGITFKNGVGTDWWTLSLGDIGREHQTKIIGGSRLDITRIPTQADMEKIRQYKQAVEVYAAEAKKQGKDLEIKTDLMDYINGAAFEANVDLGADLNLGGTPTDTVDVPIDGTTGGRV